MPTYNPPRRGEAFVVRIALEDAANPGSFKSNPTIAAGDFKVDLDGGGEANPATTPTVNPAATIWVKITVSSSEMDADVVSVRGIDQTSPKEWLDFAISIPTTT